MVDISVYRAPEIFKSTFSELENEESHLDTVTLGLYTGVIDLEGIRDSVTIGDYVSDEGEFNLYIDVLNNFTHEDPKDRLEFVLYDSITNELIDIVRITTCIFKTEIGINIRLLEVVGIRRNTF